MEEDEDRKLRNGGGGKGNSKGTPQGGVISPLLANLYLHLLDRIWERHNLEERYRARIVRYADDLVICCTGDIEAPMKVLRYILERLELTLNETKTRIVDARKESLDFLGCNFHVRRSRKSGKHYPHVGPSKRTNQTPDKVYSTGEGGGAKIVDRFSGEGARSGIDEASGQHRTAAGETECTT